MTRTLYEDLLVHPELSSEIRDILKKAIIFRVQNVYDYEQEYQNGVINTLESFPALTPPFEVVWFEYVKSASKPIAGTVATQGVLVIRQEKNDPSLFPVPDDLRMLGGRWLVSLLYFLRFDKMNGMKFDSLIINNNGAASVLHLPLNDDGSVVHKPDGNFYYHVEVCKDHSQLFEDQGAERFNSIIGQYLTTMFSLSLMHCKNIVIEEVNPTEIGQKRKRNRHQRPTISYRVLKIKPMIRSSADKGNSAVGGKLSMHIRRGHFKLFAEDGAGLFGRHHGLYWWESSVIARDSKTKVEKTYNVIPPDSNYDKENNKGLSSE